MKTLGVIRVLRFRGREDHGEAEDRISMAPRSEKTRLAKTTSRGTRHPASIREERPPPSLRDTSPGGPGEAGREGRGCGGKRRRRGALTPALSHQNGRGRKRRHALTEDGESMAPRGEDGRRLG